MLVEAALILPLLLLFFDGMFEYGEWLMTMHNLTDAAQAGARYAATHTSPIVINGTTYGNANANVTTEVTNQLGISSLTNQQINVFLSDNLGDNLGTAWTTAQAGQYVCVQITGTYSFAAFSWLGLPSTMHVSVQSVQCSEGN